LPTLSAERVERELMRLLAAPEPIRALTLMREDGVLDALMPEATRIDRLEKLLPLSNNPLLRLAALIEVDKSGAAALAERLRLSNAARNRLVGLAEPWPLDADADPAAQRSALYRLGRERFRDLAMLLAADGRMAPARLKKLQHQAECWSQPVFPLRGDDVTVLGIAPGPRVGRLLGAVRRWWEDGDFAADRAACLARLNALASRP